MIAKETVFKTLSNRNRIEIISRLYDSDMTWSKLMFDVRVNPKSLRDHLNYLIEKKIVEKKEKKYSLTELGRDICELEFLSDIEKTIGEFNNSH